MHPTTVEVIVLPILKGVGQIGTFYVNDHIKVLYKDIDGIIHTIESGNAKMTVTNFGDALKLDYCGDLKFKIVPEESLDESHEARNLFHKMRYSSRYSQRIYYPPIQYYRPSCCPTESVTVSSCFTFC